MMRLMGSATCAKSSRSPI